MHVLRNASELQGGIAKFNTAHMIQRLFLWLHNHSRIWFVCSIHFNSEVVVEIVRTAVEGFIQRGVIFVPLLKLIVVGKV